MRNVLIADFLYRLQFHFISTDTLFSYHYLLSFSKLFSAQCANILKFINLETAEKISQRKKHHISRTVKAMSLPTGT